jgi:hypothetical protein
MTRRPAVVAGRSVSKAEAPKSKGPLSAARSMFSKPLSPRLSPVNRFGR